MREYVPAVEQVAPTGPVLHALRPAVSSKIGHGGGGGVAVLAGMGRGGMVYVLRYSTTTAYFASFRSRRMRPTELDRHVVE